MGSCLSWSISLFFSHIAKEIHFADVDEDMDPDMRSKMLEAAEKRQKLHKEAQEKE